MNNFKNELFYKYALVVFLVIAFFEGALIFALKKSFDTHIKDKLQLIASQINTTITKDDLINLQHKYKLFPLFVKIVKTNQKTNYKEGFATRFIDTQMGKEKVITYTDIKGNLIVQVSTLYSTNDDKIQLIKTISILISFIIYLIVLMIGYKFIDTISNEIELNFKKLKMFNSNVSHELKTPLAIMKSEIEVAKMSEKPDCDKLLNSLLQEIDYINDITEKLLFLTKNLKSIKKEPIDLEEMIFELYEKYASKIEFELNFGEDEYIIQGDKTLLKMALSNIIENSIKYGAGKVTVTLKKTKNKITLIISDNGIGIPEEKLPFIFDEFYRVDESHNKNIKGFGLGLSIVKNILNLHQAKIKVKSQNGVEFIIEFPSQ
ncbi:MAG: HAMP domain-containing histidine kinase [Epsilonproteobacteria bacterium]|nr:HAMP domain-containing histidine kinase [Campylobacterota bacterium]